MSAGEAAVRFLSIRFGLVLLALIAFIFCIVAEWAIKVQSQSTLIVFFGVVTTALGLEWHRPSGTQPATKLTQRVVAEPDRVTDTTTITESPTPTPTPTPTPLTPGGPS
jgi:hypothetical protein